MALKRRLLVVGLGSIGRRHARLLQSRGDCELAYCEPADAMYDLAVAEAGRAPRFHDVDAAFDWQPQAVVIATPHDLHRAQTVAALARGIHVLCEKPMSANLTDARAMRDAAQASDAVLCIGFMLQFHPVMQRLKQLIDHGGLGRLLGIRYLVGSYVTLRNSRSRYQADLPGALLMDYAHQPDIVHWLTGLRPDGVYLAGIQGGDLPLSSNPNLLSMVCDYAEPLLATIDLNYVQHPMRHECEWIGEKAWVRADMMEAKLWIGRHTDDSVTVETFLTERDDLYRAEHQAFFDATDGRRAPFRSAAQGMVSMEIVDAALRSWREQRRIPLGKTPATKGTGTPGKGNL